MKKRKKKRKEDKKDNEVLEIEKELRLVDPGYSDENNEEQEDQQDEQFGKEERKAINSYIG